MFLEAKEKPILKCLQSPKEKPILKFLQSPETPQLITCQ